MEFRSIIKSIGNAFSTYSRVPVPQGRNANWNPEDMRYTLGFFPWVGILIGALEYLTFRFLPIPWIARGLVMAVLPLIVTGGIHVDGFMDTADAFHSYGDKEKKLKILSDPHIGAFAVIRVLILGGLYVAGLMVITQGPGGNDLQSAMGLAPDVSMQREVGLIFAGTFILSRVASGFLVLTQPAAKQEGMAAALKDRAAVTGNLVLLAVQGLAVMIMGLILSPLMMTLVLLSLIFVTGWFLFCRVRPLGGITGDLAGWYLSVSECAMVLSMAVELVALTQNLSCA